MKKSTIYILTLSICLMGYPTSIKSDPLTMLGFLFLKIAPSLPILTATVTSFVTSYKIFEWINKQEHLKTRNQLFAAEKRLTGKIYTVDTSVKGVSNQLSETEERLANDIDLVSNSVKGVSSQLSEAEERLANGSDRQFRGILEKQLNQGKTLQTMSRNIAKLLAERVKFQWSVEQERRVASVVAQGVNRFLEDRFPKPTQTSGPRDIPIEKFDWMFRGHNPVAGQELFTLSP